LPESHVWLTQNKCVVEDTHVYEILHFSQQLDKKVINKFAQNKADGNESLVKHMCKTTVPMAVMTSNGTCELQYVQSEEHCE